MSTDEAAQFLTLILRGDRRGAHEILRNAFQQWDVTFLYANIVCPAMREVGALWAADSISVADEHLATGTAVAAVSELYREYRWPATRSRQAFIACPPGEQHAFGARMLADLLALDGWDELYFGADVPVEALVDKVAELKPELVVLSVTLLSSLTAAASTVQKIRLANASTKVLLGGPAVTRAPTLAEASGADAFVRSLEEAVEIARAWR